MLILNIKTVQTNVIKTLTEALKEILTDANIEFSDTGIKIVAMDSTKTVLVHLKLHSEKFDKYECKKKTIVGVSMINLFKLMKFVTNNDTLTFSMDDTNMGILTIIVENGDKNIVTTMELGLLDLDEEHIDIPLQDFDSIMTMPSSDFQKICRDYHNLSDRIEIQRIQSQLIFSCEGEFAKLSTTCGPTQEGVNFIKNNNPLDIIQGYYNLNHLVLFTKCTNLCNSVEIFMKNNFPILIIFSVGTLGNLKLALAPQQVQSSVK